MVNCTVKQKQHRLVAVADSNSVVVVHNECTVHGVSKIRPKESYKFLPNFAVILSGFCNVKM